MTKTPIYLDCHATTPIDPAVLEAMMPAFTSDFGNPSSSHFYGKQAEALVEEARKKVAQLIHANSEEIIFTSGATESNNLAIKGVLQTYHERGNHIITQVTEHKAVLDTCKNLEKHGVKVTYLGVDRHGQIQLSELEKAIRPDTLLISVMFANHEIGTLQPIAEIGKIAKKNDILFHVDAAQAAGKVPIDVHGLGIDLLSMSAHKLYGPKGVGALFIRKKSPHVRLAPLVHGGGHEGGLRSGTLNVPGIVGLGKACEIAEKNLPEESVRIRGLRDRLASTLERELDPVFTQGHPTMRLPGNLNMSFPYLDGAELLKRVNRDIAVSSGSACTSGTVEPSYVQKAIGVVPEAIHNVLRFGIGRFNTHEELKLAAECVIKAVRELRGAWSVKSLSAR